MKKFLAFLMAVVMVLSLTACGSKKDEAPAEEEKTQEAAPAEGEEEAPAEGEEEAPAEGEEAAE